MPPMRMEHVEDPVETIYRKIGMKKPGELPGFRLMGNRVLVGLYIRPEKTKSGLLLADRTRAEDKYQGKAALVLMKGHSAFQSDDRFDFGDDMLEVGDWVSLTVTDGRAINVNGCDCRVIRDMDVMMRIPAPDAVF